MEMKPMMLFKDGKRKALTLSYDDGTIHDRRFVKILNAYGIKCTFNLNSGIFGVEEKKMSNGVFTDFTRIEECEVKELYSGHEVASHTLTHPSLTEISTGMGTNEVLKDRENLERIVGEKVTGFAYPYGTFNEIVEDMLANCGIVYARTVRSTEKFDFPQDYLEWDPTCHHESPRFLEIAEEFLKDESYEAKLFYLWGHSYEFAQKDSWQMIEDFCKKMKEHEEEIWFATNMEVMEYEKAFRELMVSSDGKVIHNPTETDLWYKLGNKVCCIAAGQRQQL